MKASRREYGIDITKILSMYMVIVLHSLLSSGVLNPQNTSSNNVVYWVIENMSIVAVNLFAMITGYLMVDREWHPKRILSLWKVVVFWSVITTISIMFVRKSISPEYLIKSFFPVVFKQYWYFNAYLVLYLLIPFLNAGFKHIDEKYLKFILGSLLLLSVTVGALNNLFESSGYSALWLIIMYMAGAWIKKHKNNFNVTYFVLVMLYFLCVLLSLAGEYISLKYLGHVSHWLSYNSPLVTVQSICLFLFLCNSEVKNIKIQKLLKAVAPLTFSVYLINSNPIFLQKVQPVFWRFIKQLNAIVGSVSIIVISGIMFVTFIMLDYLRDKVFRFLSIN